MAAHGRTLSSHLGSAECTLLPCPGWDADALFPGPTLHVDGNWLAGDPAQAPVLLIAHVLAGGPCFFLRPEPNSAALPRAWTDFHALLANENRAGVLKMAGGRGAAATEVMLVPLHGRDAPGGQPVPIFAAFVASMLGGDMVRQLLITHRVPLVFDLDETLLVAKSQSQMSKEVKALRNERRSALQRATADPQQAAKLRALDREEELLLEDLSLLQQFAESDAVVFQGQRLVAQEEEAIDDNNKPFLRPVIRLPAPADDTLLTRIEPDKPISSMIFKLRPNWRAIWNYLGGLMDPNTNQILAYQPPSPKLKFEAYVCTAAERGYALEAWRVLDPQGWMIPLDQRQKRLTSGSKVKSLSAVLSLGRGPPPGPGGRAASHMPLAVIVDDRVEVWDESSRGQVLQVEPFRPWEEQAAQDCGLSDTPTMQSLSAQMVRLQSELFALRMHTFHRIQEVLRKQLDLLKQQPLDLQQPHSSYGTLLSQPPWVAAMLTAGLHRQPNPEPVPSGLQAAMQRPVDPRLLRRQQQQQQQGAPAAGPPVQQQQQQPVPQAALPPQLAGEEGAKLLAALQGVLNAPIRAVDQQHQQQPGGMMPPFDPRLAAQQRQQQQQEQQQYLQQQMPPGAAGQQRPQRQRPGRLNNQPEAPPLQPGPGVALLQQQMAADPRRRPQPVPAPAVAPGVASSASVFDILPPAAPGPQQQPPPMQPQPYGRGQPRPPPMRRLAGLHPPPQPEQQQQQQQQQEAAPARMQQAGLPHVPPAPGGPPPQQAALTQQQMAAAAAWGTASAPVQSGPMLPGMLSAPGGAPAPRPMQRMQPPPAAAAPQQQQGPPDELKQLWLDTLLPGAQGQAPPPRPMQRAQQGAQPMDGGLGAGNKRKAPGALEDSADMSRKQSRYEPLPPGGPAAAAAGRHGLGQLYEMTQRAQHRLQWQYDQQPDGSWRAAAFVGPWTTDYPPPGAAPAGTAVGPTQQAAMEAAAAAAVQQLGGGGGGRGRHGPPPGPQGPPGRPPLPPGAQPGAPGGAAGITSRTALETLQGHFPGASNSIDWHDQAPGPDGTYRCRLTINGGEFDAMGVAPAGPRADKRARQNAALQVLQRLGYGVSFDVPVGPVAGTGGAGFGRGRGGGQRYGGRSLDARQARAVQQGQQGVSRDAYLASLQDELA